jgi:hypothetical protein
MTPEQKLHAKLKTQLTNFLPKGRWMLQRIETSTGSGVPDCYFSYAHVDESYRLSNVVYKNYSCWLETKTKEYKVTPEQINWQHAHALTGGKAWVVTEFNKEIQFLNFDDRMTDCSSLGVYIRRHSPFMLNLVQWLTVCCACITATKQC